MDNNRWKELYKQSLFWKNKETGEIIKIGKVSDSYVEWHNEDGILDGTSYDLFLLGFIPLNHDSMEVILFEKDFQKLLKKYKEKENEIEIANSINRKGAHVLLTYAQQTFSGEELEYFIKDLKTNSDISTDLKRYEGHRRQCNSCWGISDEDYIDYCSNLQLVMTSDMSECPSCGKRLSSSGHKLRKETADSIKLWVEEKNNKK